MAVSAKSDRPAQKGYSHIVIVTYNHCIAAGQVGNVRTVGRRRHAILLYAFILICRYTQRARTDADPFPGPEERALPAGRRNGPETAFAKTSEQTLYAVL